MKRSSRSDGPEPGASPLEAFGAAGEAAGEAWMDLVRASERPRALGRIGPYELRGEVREGGQGLVFRAVQPGTGREIALKRLTAGAFSSPSERRRFEREVELVAGLSHPNIVTVHGVEDVDGVPLLAMEWVDGRPITTWARELGTGPDATRAKLRAFLDVCGAVQHAHRSGVIHRDLKPSNLLVEDGGRVRVLDFGLARRLPEAVAGGEEAADAPRTIGFLGTPAYAAPEQFVDDAAPLDVRGDVYSLGVVLLELLTGRRPFEATQIGELIEQVTRQDPPRPSSLVPGLDRDLDAIALKALAKDPARRYQTVHALTEDVERHLAGRPVEAVAPSLGYLAGKWIGRHRLVSALSLLLAATALGSAVLGVRQTRRIADERDRAELESERARTALERVEDEKARVVEARDALQTALGIAQTERDKAVAVHDFYLDAILAEQRAQGFGAPMLVRDVVERMGSDALERYDEQPALAAELLGQVARTTLLVGRKEAALQLARAGLDAQASAPAADAGARAMLLNVEGQALSLLGRPEEARAPLEESVRTYASIDPLPYTRNQVLALTCLAQLQGDLGQPAAAVDTYREALRCLAGIPVPRRSWDHQANEVILTSALARALIAAGEPGEAERVLLAERAEVTGSSAPDSFLHEQIYEPLAAAYLLRGAHTEVAELFADCADLYRDADQERRDALASDALSAAIAMRTARAYEPTLAVLDAALGLRPDTGLAGSLERVRADTLGVTQHWEEALATYRLAADHCKELPLDDPVRQEVLIERLRLTMLTRPEGESEQALFEVLDELVTSGPHGASASAPHLAALRECAERLHRSDELDAALADAGMR